MDETPPTISDVQVDAILDEETPVFVLGLFPGSLAQKAGVLVGDRIVAVNDRPVRSRREYLEGLSEDEEKTKLSIIRNKTQFLEIEWSRKDAG